MPDDADRLPDERLEDVDALVAKLLADGQPDIYRRVIREIDRCILLAVVQHHSGNQLQSASRLGISRMTLRKKLDDLGCKPRSVRRLRKLRSHDVRNHLTPLDH